MRDTERRFLNVFDLCVTRVIKVKEGFHFESHLSLLKEQLQRRF